MSKTRHSVIPRVLNLIWNERGELLLLEWSEIKGEMAGWWNPPGGHIEHGEGVIEAGKREVKEETGIEVVEMLLKGVVHVSGFFGKDILLFVTECKVSSDLELVESEEGRLAWVSPAALSKMKVFEDLELIIKKVVEMKEGVFTARSQHDNGKLVEWVWED